MPDNEADRLAELVWQARIGLDRLRYVHCTPRERAEALRFWDEVRREHDQNPGGLEEITTRVGLSPIKLYLRLIDPDLRRARFNGSIKKVLDKGKRRPRPFEKEIDIAERILEKRFAGLTLEKACHLVAKELGLQSGEAARKIYEKQKSKLLIFRRK